MARLALEKVLVGAVSLPWAHRRAFARALAFPALAMLALYAADWGFYDDLGSGAGFAIYLFDKLLWVVFAVCCHRLVLVDVASSRPRWGRRETVFAAWLLLLGACGWLLALPLMTLVVNAQTWYGLLVPRSKDEIFWASWLGYAVAGYVWARLSPVLPATAIDAPTSISQAWADTRGNGLRMMVLVFALPMAVKLGSEAIYRDDATVVEALLIRALIVVALAFEVAALSLAYRELVAMRDPSSGAA